MNELITTPQTEVPSIFSDTASFEAAQRVGKALCMSTLIPENYRGAQNLPNVLVALEYANRLKASPLMVMQHLAVIHGRPSPSASFLVATVNASGKFSPIRYRWVGEPTKDDYGCRAYASDKSSGEVCEGATITIGMAKAEGWYGKTGSKWKTMPQQMLMYRAASFWVRAYAPELSMGMMTQEESSEMPAPAREFTQVTVADPEPVPALSAPVEAADVTVEPQPASVTPGESTTHKADLTLKP